MGSTDWVDTFAEGLYVDYTVLVALIAVAIFFEIVHRFIHDRVERYGKFSFKRRLWERMNSEFMVLGFIAFVVYLSARVLLITALTPSSGPGPTNDNDLRHAIEDTHMRLFLAVVLYFVLISFTVRNAEKKMRGWCHAELHHANRGTNVNPYMADKQQEEFYTIRDNFLHDYFKDQPGDAARFNFAAYLVLSLEELLVELVTIHDVTWVGVGLLYLILGLTSGFASLTDNGEILKLLFVQVIVIMLMCILAVFARTGYIKCQEEGWWKIKIGRYRTEVWILRCMQIGFFFMCYTVVLYATAEFVIADYGEHPALRAGTLLLYVVSFICIWVYFPTMLTQLNMVMRLPPFVDKLDKEMIARVLRNDYYQIPYFITGAERLTMAVHKIAKSGVANVRRLSVTSDTAAPRLDSDGGNGPNGARAWTGNTLRSAVAMAQTSAGGGAGGGGGGGSPALVMGQPSGEGVTIAETYPTKGSMMALVDDTRTILQVQIPLHDDTYHQQHGDNEDHRPVPGSKGYHVDQHSIPAMTLPGVAFRIPKAIERQAVKKSDLRVEVTVSYKVWSISQATPHEEEREGAGGTWASGGPAGAEVTSTGIGVGQLQHVQAQQRARKLKETVGPIPSHHSSSSNSNMHHTNTTTTTTTTTLGGRWDEHLINPLPRRSDPLLPNIAGGVGGVAPVPGGTSAGGGRSKLAPLGHIGAPTTPTPTTTPTTTTTTTTTNGTSALVGAGQDKQSSAHSNANEHAAGANTRERKGEREGERASEAGVGQDPSNDDVPARPAGRRIARRLTAVDLEHPSPDRNALRSLPSGNTVAMALTKEENGRSRGHDSYRPHKVEVDVGSRVYGVGGAVRPPGGSVAPSSTQTPNTSIAGTNASDHPKLRRVDSVATTAAGTGISGGDAGGDISGDDACVSRPPSDSEADVSPTLLPSHAVYDVGSLQSLATGVASKASIGYQYRDMDRSPLPTTAGPNGAGAPRVPRATTVVDLPRTLCSTAGNDLHSIDSRTDTLDSRLERLGIEERSRGVDNDDDRQRLLEHPPVQSPRLRRYRHGDDDPDSHTSPRMYRQHRGAQDVASGSSSGSGGGSGRGRDRGRGGTRNRPLSRSPPRHRTRGDGDRSDDSHSSHSRSYRTSRGRDTHDVDSRIGYTRSSSSGRDGRINDDDVRRYDSALVSQQRDVPVYTADDTPETPALSTHTTATPTTNALGSGHADVITMGRARIHDGHHPRLQSQPGPARDHTNNTTITTTANGGGGGGGIVGGVPEEVQGGQSDSSDFDVSYDMSGSFARSFRGLGHHSLGQHSLSYSRSMRDDGP